MRMRVSIETPKAFSMRNAISGDRCVRSFTKADKATRVMPKACAAAVTDNFTALDCSAHWVDNFNSDKILFIVCYDHAVVCAGDSRDNHVESAARFAGRFPRRH